MDASKDLELIKRFSDMMRQAKRLHISNPKNTQFREVISQATRMVFDLRRRKCLPKSKLNTCIGMARAWAGYGTVSKTQIRIILARALEQTDYFD